MKLRRYISLVLLAVYLFAAGGSALVSLTCKCVALHHIAAACSLGGDRAQNTPAASCCHPGDRARNTHATACCPHTGRTQNAPAAAGVNAPCCGDRHSTEIKLYTGSGSDDERIVRCAVTDLPPLLASSCPCPAHVPALRIARILPPAPPLCPDLSATRELRAPPVLA